MAGTRAAPRSGQGNQPVATGDDPVQSSDGQPANSPAGTTDTLAAEEEDLLRRLAQAERRRRVEALRRKVALAESSSTDGGDDLGQPTLSEQREPETLTENRRHARQDSGNAEETEPKRQRPNDSGALVEKPPEYWGKNQRQFHAFTRACEITFRVRPSQYETDASKILLAMQQLRGEPASAWQREEKIRGEDTTSWQEFKQFLHDLLLDPVNRSIIIAQAYDRAHQERNQSVQAFVAYLDELEADLPDIGEEARRLNLLVKLRPELHRAITNYQDVPESRAAVITLAMRLEENQRQARGHQQGPSLSREETRAHARPGDHSPAKTTSHPNRGTQAGPLMQRAQNGPRRLSNQEYERRRKENLCFECGQAGHAASACPKRMSAVNREPRAPAPRLAFVHAPPGTKQETPIGTRMEVEVQLEGPNGWVKRRALLDSGANVNFISQLCAKECDLSGDPTHFTTARLANGAALQTYGSHLILTRIGDTRGTRREEREQFLAADITDYDLILGTPWLGRHNPRINWREGVWTFPNVASDVQLVEEDAFANLVTAGAHAYAVFAHTDGPEGQLQPPIQACPLPKEYADYQDVFSEDLANQLPEHGPQDHAIETRGGDPPFGPLYNLSASELVVLKDYIEENLRKGFIQPSTSPAGAPILFVKKKDGGLRLCVDYRGLNRITVKNRYPLPLIGEALDRLVGAKVYTKLDIRAAYNLIRIKEGDEWKTAFRTRYGHFEYKVLPFGLANAPATFQGYINKVLSKYLDDFCIVYLDDILIYSEDPKDHTEHVRKVLDQLRKHRLFAKAEKCEFRVTTVGFLGYTLTPKGVEMERSRITTVLEWPEPKTVRDVQVFLGFANFYRRFVKGFSRVAAPLTNLLQGGKNGKYPGPFTMTPEGRQAFNDLKKAFTQAPMLAHYNPEAPIKVETDASGFAISGILSQPVEEPAQDQPQVHWHPVAFWSRKMDPAERNYETHDAELLAIVESFKHWRHYLEGAKHPIKVLTDHANLRYIGTKALTRRQARWSLTLSAYDFELEYRPGTSNPADGPSRRPDYAKEDEVTLLDRIPTLQVKLQHAQRKQDGLSSQDPTGGTDRSLPQGTDGPEHLVPRLLAAKAARDETPYEPPTGDLRELLRETQQNDALARQVRQALTQAGTTPSKQVAEDGKWSEDPTGLLLYEGNVYVPRDSALRAEVLRQHHDDVLAGHFGRARTLELVGRKYYWPGLSRDVKDYVAGCDACQRSKAPRHKPHGLLQPLQAATRPLGDITMDFITGLPPSKSCGQVYDAILVIVDRFTKIARYVPVRKTIDAPELADTLIKAWVKDFGLPDSIVSDRGSVFTAKFWSSLCYYLKIKRRLSTAFHPQTDGQTERQNQTLEQYLRAFTNYQQDDWADLLPLAEFAYNNSHHASLGTSPFYALMGLHPSFSTTQEEPLVDTPAAAERVRILTDLRTALTTNLEEARTHQSRYYNIKRKPRTYQVGDRVWLNAKNIRTRRPSRKLDYKQLGPFTITEAVGSGAYRLKLPPSLGALHPVFLVVLLEPYTAPPDGNPPAPPPVEVQGEEEYQVESILDSRRRGGQVQYLVRWQGYSPEHDGWEPASHLHHAAAHTKEFHRRYPTKPRPLPKDRTRHRN